MADLVVYKVPTIAELFSDDLEEAFQHETLNLLLSKEPKKEWIKTNAYANNSKYLPIDKVEYLLKKIFKQYRIEVTGQGTSFNGVWVTVRVHYVNPVNGEWSFHDGIGAEAMQVKAGTSPADLANINKGAISMAFPKAKSSAIKDACHHFGKLFGADLNRLDTLSFDPDKQLLDAVNKQAQQLEDLIELFELKKDSIQVDAIREDCQRVIDEKEVESYSKITKLLQSL